MRIIYNRCTNPYFNLASEQYLTESYSGEDIFMLWRNAPSVIIGKNQNTWAEINEEYVKENGITVARRLTGGGAVFHDLGNVNFSFITKHSGDTRLNFEKFGLPVVNALRKMGINAVLDGRNDIIADGYKISGNAQCVLTSKTGTAVVLHHGTLLFDVDPAALAGALRVNEKKIAAKGIKSVRSRVKNISEFESYTGERTPEGFISSLFSEISGGVPGGFSDDEIRIIEKMRDEKFARWEWNYGQSPPFEIFKEERFPFGTVSVMINCEKGKIKEIHVFGDFFGTRDKEELEKLFSGVTFDREMVGEALCGAEKTIGEVINGASPDDLIKLIFD